VSTESHPSPASSSAYQSSKWSGQSRGGALGNWIFIVLIRTLGIRAAYSLLVPVAAYYLVASPRSVRSSYHYLRRILGDRAIWAWPFLIYRHFFSLGMSLLDRFAMMLGRLDFSCTHEGEEQIEEALARGKGVILISAHVGNWAAGGHLLPRYNTRVNLVVLENEVERVQRVLDRAYSNRGFHVLGSSPDLSSSMAIMAALRNGEIVIFNGDRAIDGTNAVEVPFLGDPADFPVGAYLMASVTGSPVLQTFAMREGVNRYRFFCRALTSPSPTRKNRQAALTQCAQEFAQSLEEMVRRYPFQWYNFYPFWKDPK